METIKLKKSETVRFQQKIVEEISSKNYLLVVRVNKDIVNDLKKNLNIESISNLKVDDFHPDILEFNVRTYDKLTKSSNPIEPLFRHVYGFFDYLNDEDRKNIIRLYYLAKVIFIQSHLNLSKLDLEDSDGVQDIVDNIVDVLNSAVYNVFSNQRMIDQLFEYAKCMPIPDLSGLGSRPQDTKESTFVLADYHVLNVLMLITKILSPIFGEISAFSNTANIKGTYKEFLASRILSLLLDTRFDSMVDKLNYYISNRITNDKVTLKHLFGGVSKEGIKFKIFAKILVKDLPNTVLLDDCSTNVMTKINSTINHGITHPENTNDHVSERFDNDSEGVSDDEKKHIIDIHIPKYVNSPHKEILIQNMINELVDEVLTRTGVSREDFDNMVSFYLNSVVRPTQYNEFMIVLLFQKSIYGSRSIKHANYETFVKLLTLSQLELINRNAPSYFTHFMTVKNSSEVKKHISTIDAQLGIDKSQVEYRYLFQYFTHLSDTELSNKWDEIFTIIIDRMLSAEYYLVNSADLVFTKYNEENVNNSKFVYDQYFGYNFVKLIAEVFRDRYEPGVTITS